MERRRFQPASIIARNTGRRSRITVHGSRRSASPRCQMAWAMPHDGTGHPRRGKRAAWLPLVFFDTVLPVSRARGPGGGESDAVDGRTTLLSSLSAAGTPGCPRSCRRRGRLGDVFLESVEPARRAQNRRAVLGGKEEVVQRRWATARPLATHDQRRRSQGEGKLGRPGRARGRATTPQSESALRVY